MYSRRIFPSLMVIILGSKISTTMVWFSSSCALSHARNHGSDHVTNTFTQPPLKKRKKRHFSLPPPGVHSTS
ncbi:hypothetical protein B0H63DRAFT_69000 [Podospora didyma]|uniref:Uncharacterized protein n=1 Tax=Podospora didyma TaxID=330526 RepID=A0AAE0N2A8_9PEZI|nr:hypothetical protein B0H63DRAFT_69000 [Podospora didyma]